MPRKRKICTIMTTNHQWSSCPSGPVVLTGKGCLLEVFKMVSLTGNNPCFVNLTYSTPHNTKYWYWWVEDHWSSLKWMTWVHHQQKPPLPTKLRTNRLYYSIFVQLGLCKLFTLLFLHTLLFFSIFSFIWIQVNRVGDFQELKVEKRQELALLQCQHTNIFVRDIDGMYPCLTSSGLRGFNSVGVPPLFAKISYFSWPNCYLFADLFGAILTNITS